MTLDRRLAALRWLAWACLALMLVVTSSSAWLRLDAPRAACADWPSCRAASAAAPPAAAPAPMSAVRAIHRISASTVLVLAAVMGLMARGPAPRLHAAGRSALLLLALALGLSALGIVTPGSRAGGVLLGNLLGGFLMLAVSWSLVLRLKTPPALQESPWLRVGAGAAVLLWLVQAALGALSGAGGHAAASWLHVLLGMVAAAGALALGALAYRRGRRGPGMALMLLATLQPMLGAAAAILLAPPALVLIHNASAALGLALLLGLAVPGGRAVPSRRSGEP